MGRTIAGIFAVLVLGAIGLSTAVAEDTVAVAYAPDGGYGELSIAGPAGAEFQVWGEQPNGDYEVVATGTLDSAGLASGNVAEEGPTDGSPQFVVEVGSGGGGFFAIDDPGNQWWLD